jgi:hypothetical protein
MTIDQFNPQYLRNTITASLVLDHYGETERRLKAAPIGPDICVWKLVYSKGPKFFVLRDLLRRSGLPFTVCDEPLTLTSLSQTVLLTAKCIEDGQPVRVRTKMLEADKMPLYVEAGDWDVPQINPMFDWTEAQAWGYLIHRGLVDLYNAEATN